MTEVEKLYNRIENLENDNLRRNRELNNEQVPKAIADINEALEGFNTALAHAEAGIQNLKSAHTKILELVEAGCLDANVEEMK